jgi:hypothetical protein
MAAWFSHFAVILNDVFLLRWQAEHLSLHAPESFYNGFFPIGAPFVLRLASTISGNPVLLLILFQVALAPLYVILIYRLFVRIIPGRGIAIALPLALFPPPMIHAILSATPDFFAALAVLAGFVLLTHERRWSFLLAGVCLGLGCLFRSHVLVLLVTIALTTLLFQKDHRIRSTMNFLAGALPFVIAQGLLQLWTGHGFFENAQAFNIWKTMHGMDWSNPPALGHAKALGVVMEDPKLFIFAACNWIFQYLFYVIPFIGVIILSLTRFRATLPISRPLVFLSVAAFAYLLIVAAGGSVSAFTSVIPIAAACVIPLIEFAIVRRSLGFQKHFVVTIAIIVWITSFAGLFDFTRREADRIDDYAKIEQLLGVHSRSDALAVFTDDYDFYFPGLHYQAPRHTGSWGEVGLPHYVKEFPHIRNAPALSMHDDLLQNGIEWAIYRVPPYDPVGYKTIQSDSSLFRLTYRTDYHEVYRIVGGGNK